MGTIFVTYYKRQAVWVLSFPKSKLLKSFQQTYTVEIVSLLARKGSMLHVLGEYPVTDIFQGNLK